MKKYFEDLLLKSGEGKYGRKSFILVFGFIAAIIGFILIVILPSVNSYAVIALAILLGFISSVVFAIRFEKKDILSNLNSAINEVEEYKK